MTISKRQFGLCFFLITALGIALCQWCHAAEPEKYLFRYKFRVGDVMKWNVIQQVTMMTSVSSERNTTETYSRSTKVWKVLSVDENGTAMLEYSVQDADLRNKSSSDGVEKRYNSEKDEKPHFDFIDVARSLKKPLAHFTINSKGEVLKKTQKAEYADAAEENKITIPMPEQPIAVGETWSFSEEIMLPQLNGMVKKIPTRQRYILKKVENGIATIDFKTDILKSLVDDRESQMALIAKIKNGVIQFDIESGCSVSQQLDIDRNVLGALQSGKVASNIAYQSRFIEKYLRENNDEKSDDKTDDKSDNKTDETSEQNDTAM